MLNIEWLEALLSALALLSAALSVYLWKRAAAVPSLPDQPLARASAVKYVAMPSAAPREPRRQKNSAKAKAHPSTIVVGILGRKPGSTSMASCGCSCPHCEWPT
jgi:hypothetical protein